MRQALGTAVFAGMIGVTVFGLMFTPAFYVGLPLDRPSGCPAAARSACRRCRPRGVAVTPDRGDRAEAAE